MDRVFIWINESKPILLSLRENKMKEMASKIRKTADNMKHVEMRLAVSCWAIIVYWMLFVNWIKLELQFLSIEMGKYFKEEITRK